MSLLEMPAALAREAAGEADQAQAPVAHQWIEAVLVVAFAVAAVVFASSLAVVTGLV
jgi:hypothetical protein